MGERVAHAALERPDLLDAVALTEAERALVAIDPGYATASTASRLDSFLLPGLAAVRRVQRGVAGRPRLHGGAVGRSSSGSTILSRFRERFDARAFTLMAPMLDALLASYRDWGGTASPPTIAIVDWREVPTWAEFEILQAQFIELGVPTIVCDPRDLRVRRDAGSSPTAARSTWSTAAC